MTSDSAPVRPLRVARVTCALALAFAGVAGCASSVSVGPHEHLDRRTAATVTFDGRSLVLACDRSELGVNARDYVSLVSVDVNRSGRHATYLLGYAWSTLDKRANDDVDGEYALVAEDRVLALERMPDGFRSLGMHDPPFPAPSRNALPVAAQAAPEALRYFLENEDTRVLRTRGTLVDRFGRWRVQDGH